MSVSIRIFMAWWADIRRGRFSVHYESFLREKSAFESFPSFGFSECAIINVQLFLYVGVLLLGGCLDRPNRRNCKKILVLPIQG